MYVCSDEFAASFLNICDTSFGPNKIIHSGIKLLSQLRLSLTVHELFVLVFWTLGYFLCITLHFFTIAWPTCFHLGQKEAILRESCST